MSATMVAGYRHRPGNHCGSTALRNLLAFDGIEISEEMALGLGAGRLLLLRAARRPVAVALHQRPRRPARGAVPASSPAPPLRLETFDDAEASWEAARAAVDAGPPGAAAHRPLLPRPLRPLGPLPRPRGGPRRLRRRGRLPLRHRLRGAADDAARAPRRGAPRTAPGVPARRARCSPSPTPARCATPRGRRARDRAQRAADDRAGDGRVSRACPALRRFAAEVRDWPQELADWQWSARFCYQVIERRGTGGGNFRLMYSRFLAEAGPRRGAARRRGRGRLDRAGRARCWRRARPTQPDAGALGAHRRPGRARCSRPRSASGPRSRRPA